MTISLFLLIFTIFIALAFDFVNGFHDAANSIATVISTRVLKPQVAVLWAAFFNLVAMFIFAPRVAETVSKIVKIEPNDPIYIIILLAGLIGAIVWDLLTWWFRLPTSSSHALIGGLAGAGMGHAGVDALRWNLLFDTIIFIFLAPFLGFILGLFFMFLLFWVFRKWRPKQVNKLFRRGQLLSAALYSLGHGANDAQKTMGIIMALLIAAGVFDDSTKLSFFNSKTFWIILSCQLAMSLGTALGGWRIVKTMGMRLAKLKPVGGFCAETAGALSLFFATGLGIPVSTTHTITGAIVGVGTLTSRMSGPKWGIAQKIAWAWILTIPAAGIFGATCFYVYQLF
jgi:inorganic phosphate transporter, PiT family